jgi:uncharacterized protein (DUF952 family)
MSTPEYIYKIATQASYSAARQSGTYEGMPVDHASGFMHFSTAEQLPDTLRLHFAGQSNLVLLAVPTSALGPDLAWEPSRGGALFPHLYGRPLQTSAVAWEAPLSVAADGSCTLPEAVR